MVLIGMFGEKLKGNKTYWRIQYGFDGNLYSSKLNIFILFLNIKKYDDNRISFTVKYYFTYLCNKCVQQWQVMMYTMNDS